MTQHTKGPWKVNGDLMRPEIVNEDNTKAIAFMTSTGGTTLDEADANTRLISAAPELLEALERVEGLLSADCCNDRLAFQAVIQHAKEEAQKAINKVKG